MTIEEIMQKIRDYAIVHAKQERSIKGMCPRAAANHEKVADALLAEIEAALREGKVVAS